MLLEHFELLEDEGINYDIALVHELYYDVATYLGDKECIIKYKLGEKYLNLFKISERYHHKQTKKFRSQLQKDWGIRT